jgi:hypothetical protein
MRWQHCHAVNIRSRGQIAALGDIPVNLHVQSEAIGFLAGTIDPCRASDHHVVTTLLARPMPQPIALWPRSARPSPWKSRWSTIAGHAAMASELTVDDITFKLVEERS